MGTPSISELLEQIRKRPGMFIGSIRKEGLMYMLENLFEELLSEAEEEPVFELDFYPGNHLLLKASSLSTQSLASVLSGDGSHRPYRLGLLVVLALSERAEIRSGDLCWQAKNGVLQGRVSSSNTTAVNTILDFTLDPFIFKDYSIRYDDLLTFLRQFAYLNPGLRLACSDHPSAQRNVFHYPRGIFDQLHHYIHPFGQEFPTVEIEAEANGYSYQIGICPHFGLASSTIKTYAGNDYLNQGGSLEEGILNGVKKAFLIYASKHQIPVKISVQKTRNYCTVLAVIKGKDFIFASPDRSKLGMPHVQHAVTSIVCNELFRWMEQDHVLADRLLSHFCDSSEF